MWFHKISFDHFIKMAKTLPFNIGIDIVFKLIFLLENESNTD